MWERTCRAKVRHGTCLAVSAKAGVAESVLMMRAGVLPQGWKALADKFAFRRGQTRLDVCIWSPRAL
jgi:hypothetical protein